MNYIQILQDSIRISRTTKLVWVFGFISFLPTITHPLFLFVRGNLFLACIYLPVILAIVLISIIAYGGLIYLIYQTILNRSLTFTEVWLRGSAKLFRNIGLLCLSSPALLVFSFSYFIFVNKAPTSPFLWLMVLIMTTFIGSICTFGICAIIIDDVKSVAAAWTSFLITLNNFFRVFIIAVGVLFIRLLGIGLVIAILESGLFKFELSIPLAFDYPAFEKIMAIPIIGTAGWVIDLLLIPLTSAILTICYLKFSTEIHYPALSST